MKSACIAVALVIGMMFSNPTLAQRTSNYFMLGVGLGTTNYKGDLDDNFTLKFTKPGLCLMAGYKFKPHWKLRFELNQGWIGASDAKVSTDLPRLRRNLSFKSALTEFSGQIVFDLFANHRKYIYRTTFSPYLFTGIAVFHFNPKAELNGTWYALQPLGTEGQNLNCADCPKPYSRVQIAIPFGAGMRLSLTEKIDLNFEFGVRKTFTDYLDDVSGDYPDMVALQAQSQIAYELSDRIDRNEYPLGAAYVNGIRGNEEKNDWYILTMVSAVYLINWNGNPKFRERN